MAFPPSNLWVIRSFSRFPRWGEVWVWWLMQEGRPFPHGKVERRRGSCPQIWVLPCEHPGPCMWIVPFETCDCASIGCAWAKAVTSASLPMHGFMHALTSLTLFIDNGNSPFQTVAPLWNYTWTDESFWSNMGNHTCTYDGRITHVNHKVVSISFEFHKRPWQQLWDQTIPRLSIYGPSMWGLSKWCRDPWTNFNTQS